MTKDKYSATNFIDLFLLQKSIRFTFSRKLTTFKHCIFALKKSK